MAWTTTKVEELIQLLEQCPCLYNTKEKSYHDKEMRGKAIAEIARLLRRWRFLVSEYDRYKNIT